MLDVWQPIAALLVSGAVGGGLNYWVATTYLASSTLEIHCKTQGALKPSQDAIAPKRPNQRVFVAQNETAPARDITRAA
jgi:hypothetical protein